MKVLCLAALVLFTIVPVLAAPPRPATAQTAPTLSVTYRKITRKKAKRYEAIATYPVFAPTSAVARLANARLRAFVEQELRDFVQMARDTDDPAPAGTYSLELTPQIGIARPNLISVYFDRYEYAGGAHPNTDMPAQTFGLVRGQPKRLQISDLFHPDAAPYSLLTGIALPELKARGASSVTDGVITRLDRKTVRNWVVTPRGITLLFAPYDVASYAEGPFIVKCDFGKMTGGLDPEGPLRDVLE